MATLAGARLAMKRPERCDPARSVRSRSWRRGASKVVREKVTEIARLHGLWRRTLIAAGALEAGS